MRWLIVLILKPPRLDRNALDALRALAARTLLKPDLFTIPDTIRQTITRREQGYWLS